MYVDEDTKTRGTLDVREPHPASQNALAWLQSLPMAELAMWQESFASCSIEDNRLAEVCSETLGRLLSGEKVSDRYVLGLAWAMRYREDEGEGDETEGDGE